MLTDFESAQVACGDHARPSCLWFSQLSLKILKLEMYRATPISVHLAMIKCKDSITQMHANLYF